MKFIAMGDFHGKFPKKLKRIIEKEDPDFILVTGDYAGTSDWRPFLKKMFKAREKGKKIDIEDLLGEKEYEKLVKKDYKIGKKIIEELDKLNIKVFTVFGNADWHNQDEDENYAKLVGGLKNILNLNRGKFKIQEIKLVGFGGYLNPSIYFTEKGRKAIADSKEENKERKEDYNKEKKDFLKLMKNKPDILLTHYTPYDCLDKMEQKGFALSGQHMGVKFYNEGIKKYKPELVICGHMHENQGKCKIENTLVINPGAVKDGKAAIIEFDEVKKRVKNVRFIS